LVLSTLSTVPLAASTLNLHLSTLHLALPNLHLALPNLHLALPNLHLALPNLNLVLLRPQRRVVTRGVQPRETDHVENDRCLLHHHRHHKPVHTRT
jgi:hypothetical protein